MEKFNVNKIYKSYEYPVEYNKVLELNLVNLDVWYFMDAEQVEKRITGLKKRYRNRKLIPFSRRDDCDDIACFEVGKKDKVEIIHDFSDSGWEQRREYECFWDWFRDAIEELISWGQEENSSV